MKTVKYPNKILTTPTDKIIAFGIPLTRLADKMKSHMRSENGMGLAANQVGIGLSMFVHEKPNWVQGRWIPNSIVCNPTWKPTPSGFEYARVEGCLSFPGWLMPVKRYDAIIAQYQNALGRKIKCVLHGAAAQVFQHETEHLNGELFTKHLTLEQQETLRKYYKE
jgi:peptide deformylase